jgi:hypothetical protein
MVAVGRLIATVSALTLVAGCTTYKGSKDTAQVGGGLFMTTLIIGGSIADKSENISGKEAAQVMLPIMAIGAVIALVGLGGMAVHRIGRTNEDVPVKPPPIMQPQPPPYVTVPDDQDRKRRVAWDMTQQARTAAFQNDCQRVAYLAARVVEVDRPTFDNVFSRDPYIIKCAPVNQQPPEPPRAIPIPPLNPQIPPPPPAEPPATP